MANSIRIFTALLEPDGTRLRWVIVRLPFDPVRAWPQRNGRRVKGEIEGFAFRTSLFPDPKGEGQVLLVNKKMQQAAGVRVGEKAASGSSRTWTRGLRRCPPSLRSCCAANRS
jgi:hypothetical protein